MKKLYIGFKAEPEIRQELEVLAKLTNKNLSEVIRDCIVVGLEMYRTVDQLGVRRLVGRQGVAEYCREQILNC